jgi:hypothetical protein
MVKLLKRCVPHAAAETAGVKTGIKEDFTVNGNWN